MNTEGSNSGLISLCLSVLVVLLAGLNLLRNDKARKVERIADRKDDARSLASDTWSICRIDREPVAKLYIEEYVILTLIPSGEKDELNAVCLFFRPHHLYFSEIERLVVGDEVEFHFCDTCLVKGFEEDVAAYLRVKNVQAPK